MPAERGTGLGGSLLLFFFFFSFFKKLHEGLQVGGAELCYIGVSCLSVTVLALLMSIC